MLHPRNSSSSSLASISSLYRRLLYRRYLSARASIPRRSGGRHLAVENVVYIYIYLALFLFAFDLTVALSLIIYFYTLVPVDGGGRRFDCPQWLIDQSLFCIYTHTHRRRETLDFDVCRVPQWRLIKWRTKRTMGVISVSSHTAHARRHHHR